MSNLSNGVKLALLQGQLLSPEIDRESSSSVSLQLEFLNPRQLKVPKSISRSLPTSRRYAVT